MPICSIVEIHFSFKIPCRKKISLKEVFVWKIGNILNERIVFLVYVSSSWLCWDGESFWLGFGFLRRLFGFGIRGHLASPGLSSLSSAWPSPSTTPPAKYDLKLFLHHENSIGVLLHKTRKATRHPIKKEWKRRPNWWKNKNCFVTVRRTNHNEPICL